MKRALAMFAKTPQPGLVKTRLTPPLTPEKGAELYRCLLLDTITRVRTLPVDAYICYDGDEEFFRRTVPGVALFPQQGEGLGERLERAFAALESMGCGARVVIGTDAPDLPLAYIEEAFRLLETGTDVVFGPAEDGGYYLVALRGGHGDIFENIPWSGPRVLEKSLQRAAESDLSIALLPLWYDVDSFQDLLRPSLADPSNGAPLTRAFIEALEVDALAYDKDMPTVASTSC